LLKNKLRYIFNLKQWLWEPLREKFWEKLLKEFFFNGHTYESTPKFPLHLDLEINSRCNFSCAMCPQSMPKNDQGFKQGRMTALNALEIIEYCSSQGTKSIKPFWRGEPTINPDLPRVMSFAKRKGLFTMMNTNGSFPLNNREDIIDSIEWISFSLDRYHSNNQNNPKILDHVLFFKENGVHTEIQSSTPDDKLIDFCNQNHIIFSPDRLTERTKTGGYTYMRLDGKKRKNCNFPFWRMIISWDLMVKPCCVSWNDGELDMGSLKDSDGQLNVHKIKQVWKSYLYRSLRNQQRTLKFRSSACRSCVSSSAYIIEDQTELSHV